MPVIGAATSNSTSTFWRRQDVFNAAVRYKGPRGAYEIPLLFQSMRKKQVSKQMLVPRFVSQALRLCVHSAVCPQHCGNCASLPFIRTPATNRADMVVAIEPTLRSAQREKAPCGSISLDKKKSTSPTEMQVSLEYKSLQKDSGQPLVCPKLVIQDTTTEP